MTERADPRELKLTRELHKAYEAMGTSTHGPEVRRYHKALARYVDYARQHGGAAEFLLAVLRWYDAQHGPVHAGPVHEDAGPVEAGGAVAQGTLF
jgi:hypothetical protein